MEQQQRRIRLLIQYDGTDYVGWQTQPNGPAVQEVIEKAILEITGRRSTLQGSGRTDSGVHARAQVAHFDTGVRMAADKFAVALNTRLPGDIRIIHSEETDGDFHARFSAKKKQYRYCIQTGPHALVPTRNTALHIHAPLDLSVMEAAAAQLVGTHDFRGLRSSGVDVETTVRTIYSSAWTKDGPYLYYDVCGSGFLYNMVRIIAGTMIDMGKGVLPPDALLRALETGDRRQGGATAPAHGLTLWRVMYPGYDTEDRIRELFSGEAKR